MGQYLIDNNVISNYFSEYFSEEGMKFVSNVIDLIPNISVITEIEALSWVNPDKNKEKVVRQFILESNILTITPEVATQCVAIKRNRKIKTPDAIIAATALVHNMTLITGDGDFDTIPGLHIINPIDLK